MYVCMHACMCVCMYVCVYYICMYVCMYIYICMYVFIYVYNSCVCELHYKGILGQTMLIDSLFIGNGTANICIHLGLP